MSKKLPKYYRILGSGQSKTHRQLTIGQALSPQKLTQSIVRSKNYVYIDINSQNGICQMEPINPEEADQDAEKLAGNNFICAINRLPQQSQKTIDYVYRIQQLRKQRDKFKQLLKDSINETLTRKKYSAKKLQENDRLNAKSLDNKHAKKTEKTALSDSQKILKKREKSLVNRNLSTISAPTPLQEAIYLRDMGMKEQGRAQKQNLILYRGMDTKSLKQYLEKKELENLNNQIIEKQKMLIAKYGFTNQYQSITKQKSPIVRQSRKIILPDIKSSVGY